MSRQGQAQERKSLEEIAELSLRFGRLLMEAGGSARQVDEISTRVARGLGAEWAEVRVGYASLALTVGIGSDGTTRMCKVGSLGVNQTVSQALHILAAKIKAEDSTVSGVRAKLEEALQRSSSYPYWVIAMAAGVACAAFGRLLDVDWAGVVSIMVATAMAQLIRRKLALHNVNVFLATTVVSFLASVLCGLGARWLASETVAKSMVVTVLLLVPGVPAFNAQLDILEGRPTLASARTVWVITILVFMTLGVWIARGVLQEGR